jgi:predicted MFS family arabinose efflux permease
MPALRFFRASRVLALCASMALFSVTATALGADVPPEKRAAIDAALGKGFAASKVPGVVVGIWIRRSE